MLLEVLYRIGRIRYQDIKCAVFNSFVWSIFQAVAENNVSFAGTVHKQRYFRNAGEAVVFFDSENMIPSPRIIAV